MFINPFLLTIFWMLEVTMPIARFVDKLGEFLIADDKHDIGYYSYKNRKNHTYHGRKAPNHPSVMHHWQVGALGIFTAHMLAAAALFNAMMSEEEKDYYVT